MVSVKHLAQGQHGDQNGCTEQYGEKRSFLGLRLRSFFSFGASAHVQTLPQRYVTALTQAPLLATARSRRHWSYVSLWLAESASRVLPFAVPSDVMGVVSNRHSVGNPSGERIVLSLED